LLEDDSGVESEMTVPDLFYVNDMGLGSGWGLRAGLEGFRPFATARYQLAGEPAAGCRAEPLPGAQAALTVGASCLAFMSVHQPDVHVGFQVAWRTRSGVTPYLSYRHHWGKSQLYDDVITRMD
jgi:hypothetical protein